MSKTMGLYLLLAVFAGVLGGVHIPINGALGARINSVLVATLTFYGVAFTFISVVVLIRFDRSAFQALADSPRWYLIAGFISVLVVTSSTFLIPRIGAFNLFAILVSSQLLVRMLISHYGWLESPIHPVTLSKVLGSVLLLCGAFLVVRPSS